MRMPRVCVFGATHSVLGMRVSSSHRCSLGDGQDWAMLSLRVEMHPWRDLHSWMGFFFCRLDPLEKRGRELISGTYFPFRWVVHPKEPPGSLSKSDKQIGWLRSVPFLACRHPRGGSLKLSEHVTSEFETGIKGKVTTLGFWAPILAHTVLGPWFFLPDTLDWQITGPKLRMATIIWSWNGFGAGQFNWSHKKSVWKSVRSPPPCLLVCLLVCFVLIACLLMMMILLLLMVMLMIIISMLPRILAECQLSAT